MKRTSSNDEEKNTESSSEEEQACLISRLLFTWATPLFREASHLGKIGKAVDLEHLLHLPCKDNGDVISCKFEHAWKEAIQTEKEPVLVKRRGKETTNSASESKGLPDAHTPSKSHSTTVFRHAICAVLGRRFVMAGIIRAINSCVLFSLPLLIYEILRFIEELQQGSIQENDPWQVRYRGYWLSACLGAAMCGKAILEGMYFHRVFRCAFQTRVAISVAVYNKALRLANAERQSTTLGELVNLMQVDATKVEELIPQLHVLWDGLFQIAGFMLVLYTLIGWPCFVGLSVMFVAVPIQIGLMKKLYANNRRMVTLTDDRVEIANEALQGIQCVKMYCWEESFETKISQRRAKELKFLKQIAYIRGFARAYMGALPSIVAVTSFVTYALVYEGSDNISASKLFASLAVFEQIRIPLLFYPAALGLLVQARVSAMRVEAYLKMDEIGEGKKVAGSNYAREIDSEKAEIIVDKATIYWSDPSKPLQSCSEDCSLTVSTGKSNDDSEPISTVPSATLNNVSMHVRDGELCAVVGRVASGKSTLCSAILNETILAEGSISLKGQVAYAAQSPWILNATLRDNILFGHPMDHEKYSAIIKACQLTHDLEVLEDGDLTEIGEKGINLSGGQKQRISIARAAYSDANVIILDDPLSALDPEVGERLFNECIVKFMNGKTRLLVTNQLQFLRQCDKIIVLGNRQVIEQGTYNELMSDDRGEISRLLKDNLTEESSNKRSDSRQAHTRAFGELSKSRYDSVLKEAKSLMSKEERQVGAISWSVYQKYMMAGGGYLKAAFVVFSFVCATLVQLGSTAWVSYWTRDATYTRHSEAFYLGIYAAFALSLGAFQYNRTFLLARFGVLSSLALHNRLASSIFRAPQSFFDTTPVGRIISRFSKDMYTIDIELMEWLDYFISIAFVVLFSTMSIVFVTPWFGIALIPLGIIYIRFLNYYRRVSRETKRLDSISRSPVYAKFSETLGGLSTIRAYDGNSRFITEFEDKINVNTRANYCNRTADRWLSVRLELVGAAIVGLAAVFATNVAISTSISGRATDTHFASLAGLSLTMAVGLTSVLNYAVRTFALMENAMNSCERILHYTEQIPQEAPRTRDELESLVSSCDEIPLTNQSAFAVAASGSKPPSIPQSWPDKGQIVLKNLKMRYRTDTPQVLKGIDITIPAGEKIGIVGRTGSGKSSIFLCLLRLVEPSLIDMIETSKEYDAPLVIDGIDLLCIGLQELRSKVSIIPQNPVLFSGTIRSNIDPFQDYSDHQIWSALESCRLKKSVEMMPGLLNASVSEYGENLSAGMRQMLVLGRALLRDCRILLLDEATSSVDLETDQEIQKTIREAFKDCTVLTIAHRINTILDSDKIVVMQDGLVAEYGSPNDLLQDANSVFSDIVDKTKNENI